MCKPSDVDHLIALISSLRLIQEEYSLSLDELLHALKAAEDAAARPRATEPETEE